MKLKEHRLLDYVARELGVKNDAGLARRLNTSRPMISKIRSGIHPVPLSMFIVIHEETGTSLKALRFLNGDFREHTGRSSQVLSPEAVEVFLKQEICY